MPGQLGIDYVRELLQLDNVSDNATSTPVFMGHGDSDDKANVFLGNAAQKTMRRLGFDVEWRAYPGLGHWYKIPDEIDDIVAFIVGKCGWPDNTQPSYIPLIHAHLPRTAIHTGKYGIMSALPSSN